MIDLDNIKLYDAHIHFKSDDEAHLFLNSNIKGILSVDKISDYKKYSKFKNEKLLFSSGVHPWFSDIVSLNEMIPMIEKSEIVGEIGLDSVWTNVDIEIQKKVFFEQLEYAKNNKKAVILHTKGMELEVLQAIKEYENKYLVHWYSSDKYVDEYIALDCYFTIGPSVLWDKTIMSIANKIPLNRLLIETDGIAAVNWAYEALNKEEYEFRNALINSVIKIAEIRNIKIDKLLMAIEENFNNFIKPIN